MSQLMNTQLDRETLAMSVGLIESGANPEALAVSVIMFIQIYCLFAFRLWSRNCDVNELLCRLRRKTNKLGRKGRTWSSIVSSAPLSPSIGSHSEETRSMLVRIHTVCLEGCSFQRSRSYHAHLPFRILNYLFLPLLRFAFSLKYTNNCIPL